MSGNVYPVDGVGGVPAYTGSALRTALGAVLAGATTGRPLGARSGVAPGTPSNTVTATSTVWTVKPHAGIIDAETSASAGAYWYSFQANQTGAVNPANGSNPRIDLIYVQISDSSQSDGTPTTTPASVVVSYLAGTAAATPAVPTTPARSIVLAQINVPTSGGGAPSVTWVAPVTSAAAAVALPSGAGVMPAGTFIGEHGEHPNLGSVKWDGTQWVPTKLRWQYKKATFPNSGGDNAFHTFVMETKIIDSGDATGTDWGLASGGFSVPYAGTYRAYGSCGWTADTGSRAAVIAVNGTRIVESEQFLPSNGSSHITLLATCPVLIAANVGDVITLQGYHDLSHTVTLSSSSLSIELA